MYAGGKNWQLITDLNLVTEHCVLYESQLNWIFFYLLHLVA